jgi:signal transduction histidine kinase
VPVVDHHQILRVHVAAVAVRLDSSRSALLSGLPADLVASLPTAPTPAAQLLSDLHRLNDTGRLPDGAVPLQTWLSNAIALSGSLVKADVFRQALDASQGAPLLSPPSRRKRKILLNLVNNAVAYSAPPCSVTIRGVVEPDGMHAGLVVENRGFGIKKEHMERIFEGGFRSADAMAAAKGAGIGLYVSRRLIELHGGTIIISSEEVEPGVRLTRAQVLFPVALQRAAGTVTGAGT